MSSGMSAQSSQGSDNDADDTKISNGSVRNLRSCERHAKSPLRPSCVPRLNVAAAVGVAAEGSDDDDSDDHASSARRKLMLAPACLFLLFVPPLDFLFPRLALVNAHRSESSRRMAHRAREWSRWLAHRARA
jgi:hypothetical protein